MCAWRTSPDLGDEWYPAKCKMVLYVEAVEHARRFVLLVDSSDANIWRREPYYDLIKRIACAATENRQQFVVYARNNLTVVLPNKEVDLGPAQLGDRVDVIELSVPSGRDWRAFLIREQSALS